MDLTKAQFDAVIKRWGFRPTEFLGYYYLPKPNDSVLVSKLNAGNNRRAHLPYLIARRNSMSARDRHNDFAARLA